MHLTWEICHRDGRRKGWLWEREGGEVNVATNGQRTASVSASLEEDVAQMIHPGRSRLKVHCHPVVDDPGQFLLFNGLIQQPRTIGKRIEIPAVCPSVHLLSSSPAPFPDRGSDVASSLWDPINDEQSQVLWEIVHRSDRIARQYQEEASAGHVVPPLGIVKGDLANTHDERILKIGDGGTSWDILTEVAAKENAPDFELEPLDRDDFKHARFNTFHPHQGSDRSADVILEYGVNLADFAFEPSGVDLCNYYVLVGRSGAGRSPAYVATNRESIGRFGVWVRVESGGQGKMTELRRRAREYVSKHAYRVNFVDATPTVQVGGVARGFVRDALGNYIAHPDQDHEWAVPPSFGPPGAGFDYWLGDKITVRAKDQLQLNANKDQPGFDTDILARVTEATFREIDADANVLVSHALAPVIPAADVGGFETIVKGEQF